MSHTRNISVVVNNKNDFDHLFFVDLHLETNIFQQLHGISKVVVVSGLTTSLFLGCYFKSALYLYMFDKRKGILDRPIDVLLLVQAIVQHLLSFLMIFTYNGYLLFDITISNLFGGEAWCNIPWYGGNFAFAYRFVGGLIIAIFRLLLLFSGDWVKYKIGMKRLLCIMLMLSLTIPAALTQMFAIGNGPASRKQAMWNFCIGKSEELRNVLHEYFILQGAITLVPEHLPKIVLLLMLVCVLSELICYFVFFGHLYRHDREMLKKKILKEDAIRQRNKRNAITFIGQFWTFMTELTCLVLVIISIANQKSGIFYRMVSIIAVWVELGFVSVVEVWASRSLQYHLPHRVIYRRFIRR